MRPNASCALLVITSLLFNTALAARAERPAATQTASAADQLSQRVQTGDPNAMLEMAWMFLEGREVARNPQRASELYVRASDLGHPVALNNLGWMYEHGVGVSQSTEQARLRYLRAGQAGHVPAMYNLGRLLVFWERERGTLAERLVDTTSRPEAVRWYALLDERFLRTDPLARAWTRPPVVVERDTQAAEWLTRAANAGHTTAMVLLALMFRAGRVGPETPEVVNWYHGPRGLRQRSPTVDRNDAQFVSLVRKAADAGDAQGMWWMAVAHREGAGVPANAGEFGRWRRMAAAAGDANALLELGYEAPTSTEALTWFLAAAESGDNLALGAVFACYQGGICGKQAGGPAMRDVVRSEEWRRKAYQGGSLLATRSFVDEFRERDFAKAAAYWHEQLMNTDDPVTAHQIREAIAQDVRHAEFLGELRGRSARFQISRETFVTLLLAFLFVAAVSPGGPDSRSGPSGSALAIPGSSSARSRQCGYVSRSFMTLHGSRALFGGPGAMWVCN